MQSAGCAHPAPFSAGVPCIRSLIAQTLHQHARVHLSAFVTILSTLSSSQADLQAAEQGYTEARAEAAAAADRQAGLEAEIEAAETFARHFESSASRKRDSLHAVVAQALAAEVRSGQPVKWRGPPHVFMIPAPSYLASMLFKFLTCCDDEYVLQVLTAGSCLCHLKPRTITVVTYPAEHDGSLHRRSRLRSKEGR